MDSLLKVAFCLLALQLSPRADCQEVGVPERYLRPRNFNPHPYTATSGLRAQEDYAVEIVPGEPEAHPTLLHHPYPLFQRIDTRNNDNSPVQFPSVPPVVKKTFKSKASSKYLNVPKNYAFSYAVKDHQSGDDFSHSQAHDGKATQGEYRVKLPDGRVQVVSYTADNKGYRADVRYDGERSEKDVFREQLPHPAEVPGYISTLVHKKVSPYNGSPKASPTAPSFLIYNPESGYKPAPVLHKYKSAPLKISPTISSDGNLGYQNPTARPVHQPVYYASYNDIYASPSPAVPVSQNYVNAEDILQSITAKYDPDALAKQEATTAAPSLGDYASVRPSPAPLYNHIPVFHSSTTPAPKVVEEQNDYDYAPGVQPAAFYPSTTPSPDYHDAYFALPSQQTQQKLLSPRIKYILVPSNQYAAYKQQ